MLIATKTLGGYRICVKIIVIQKEKGELQPAIHHKSNYVKNNLT